MLFTFRFVLLVLALFVSILNACKFLNRNRNAKLGVDEVDIFVQSLLTGSFIATWF